jgi:Fic family protein
MKRDLFTSAASGHVVPTSTMGAHHCAFVPAPLPPEITYDAELVKALSRADRALGELAGLGRTIPNPKLLYQPFMRREAVLSSRIEGTQADVRDLYVFQSGKDAASRPRSGQPSDVVEVANYVAAMEYGLTRVQALPISLRLIRELHEVLMQGARGGHSAPGEFRRIQNWIGPEGQPITEARFVPPPVPDMNVALADLEHYLHAEDDTPPLVRLALSHYQFETIHPFSDGNGRIGRLLVVLLLVHWKLLPSPLLYLSAFFERNRTQYYDLLLGVSQRGAWRDWVEFFLRGVEEQALDATRLAHHVLDLQQDWRQRLTAARTSPLALRLADDLFVAPMITVPHAVQVLGVSYNTARSAVDRLVAAGILSPEPAEEPGARWFSAPELLSLVYA